MGRRKRVEEKEDEEEEEATSEEEASESSQEIVNVDFEFFDPKSEDFHGVKALLRTYLHDSGWDLSSFVEIILAQRTVGTVLKAGEDESPIGLITVLNIERYRENPGMRFIGEFLHRNVTNSEFDKLWESKKNVGLLVCERFLNVPVEVCQPLYQGLFDEVSWATEDEPTVELRNCYKFDSYLVLTKVYQEVGSKTTKKGKKPKGDKGREAGELDFVKPEDEILMQLSSWSSMFRVKPGALAAHETKGLKLFALLMSVKANRVGAFKSKLEEMLVEHNS